MSDLRNLTNGNRPSSHGYLIRHEYMSKSNANETGYNTLITHIVYNFQHIPNRWINTDCIAIKCMCLEHRIQINIDILTRHIVGIKEK